MRQPIHECDDAPVRRTVLIVDDHAGFRSMARALLESGGFDVVGEAADGATALAEAANLQPDLVLLDIQLPDLDGFAVTEQLTQEANSPVIVLTSGRPRSSFERRLADSRARAFIPKADLTSAALEALLGP
jgi:two-component system nitrate/nitrite response regulator NarL